MNRFNPIRFDAFIREAGIAHKLTKQSVILRCPTCGKKDKLWVFRASGGWTCFYCDASRGTKPSLAAVLAELTGRPVAAVRAAIYGRDAVRASDQGDGLVGTLDEEDDQDDATVVLPSCDLPLMAVGLETAEAAPGVAYLAGRGVSLELAQHYGITYDPDSRSVVFPVVADGRTVGWQSRRIDKLAQGERKTDNPEGFQKGKTLMFADRMKGSRHAVICEGPVDALKAHLVGGNVATLGKLVTDDQIALIRASGITTVYLALDRDAAAEIPDLIRRLWGLECRHVVIPAHRDDLGDCSLEEARDAILAAEVVDTSSIFVDLE